MERAFLVSQEDNAPMTMRGIKSLALLLGGSLGLTFAVQIGIVLLIGSSLTSAVVAETPLPEAIAAPGLTVVLTARAEGQQIYECKAGSDGKLAWAFREPQATLTADGKIVGRHYAGPTWELADGSAVVGKAIGNAPGATANDIAWLKLEAVSHKGSGTFSDVTTVQRINTVGGQLKDECDRLGTTRGMPYTADYVFLRK
jgi:hypothetical protein